MFKNVIIATEKYILLREQVHILKQHLEHALNVGNERVRLHAYKEKPSFLYFRAVLQGE